MNLPSFSSFFCPAALGKMLGLGVGAFAVLGGASLPGHAIGVLLDFEGVGNETPVAGYYPAATFSPNALGVVAFSAGGSGDFTNEPTPTTGMTWFDGDFAGADFSGGFNSFSTYYSSIQASGELKFFDAPGGSGSLVASRTLDPLGVDCPGGADPGAAFRCWALVSVNLPSTAASVVFSAPANEMVFDNVGFNNVPVPAPLPIVGAAAALGASRRLRQRVRAAGVGAQKG